jgi:hypothetical protein
MRPIRPRYIQVDLDLHANFPLDELVAAFGDDVCVLHCGEGVKRPGRRASLHDAVLELNLENRPLTETLRRFCTLIESLPAPAAALWKKVRRREFNIGFDSGTKRPAFNTAIAAALVARIAKLGASISVTIYPDFPQH